MTKRSAMAMAAGLATALITAVVAISLTLGSTPTANATGERKPVIKRQVQTVTVHRKAGTSSPAGVRVVQLGPSGTSTSSMGSSSDDQGFDDEGMETEGADDATFDDNPSGSSDGSGQTSQGSLGDD